MNTNSMKLNINKPEQANGGGSCVVLPGCTAAGHFCRYEPLEEHELSALSVPDHALELFFHSDSAVILFFRCISAFPV